MSPNDREKTNQALLDLAEGRISEIQAHEILIAHGYDPDDAEEQMAIARGGDDVVIEASKNG